MRRRKRKKIQECKLQDMHTFVIHVYLIVLVYIDDEELDEEDLDLLEENTGLKLSRREVKWWWEQGLHVMCETDSLL